MKRKTIARRAICCIFAFALVLSCLLTAYAGSFVSFMGDGNAGTGQVKITSNGGTIRYEIGANSRSTKSLYMTSPAIGTKCKLQAEDTDTRVFMYWQDEYTGRVYSYERTVEFTVSSRMHLRAIFARVSDTEHFVSFINYGGTVMTDTVMYNNGTTITAPTDTKIPGFTFKGWSKTENEIKSDDSDMLVFPKYTVNSESYTVNITNEDYVSGAGTYSNFQTVVVKAEEKNGSGEAFSYWKDADGTIVSYERCYSFRINYNITLTAVYGEAVTPVPVVRISKIYRDIQDTKITFYAERSVPSAYTVLSHGMLMASTSVTDSQMTVGNAGDTATSAVRKAYGASNENCGTYSLAKTKIGRNEEVTVRPFVIVCDTNGNQFITYGDIIRTTNAAES